MKLLANMLYKQLNKNNFPFRFGLIFPKLFNQSKWSLAHINNWVIATLESWFELIPLCFKCLNEHTLNEGIAHFQKLHKLQYGVFPPRRLITWRHRSRIVLMRRATRCCGIAFHSSCTRRRKSARLVFFINSTIYGPLHLIHKCSIGHPPSKDTHLFATFEMGYPLEIWDQIQRGTYFCWTV